RVAVPGVLRVLPAFGSRRFLPEKLSRLLQIDGAVLVRQRGRGSEFDSLRTYVIGDDVRAIDWRATARSRDLVVRTWRPERDRHIVLAIDTGRSSAARLGDEPRLDAALDASLLLGALAARAGDRVALVAAATAGPADRGRRAAAPPRRACGGRRRGRVRVEGRRRLSRPESRRSVVAPWCAFPPGVVDFRRRNQPHQGGRRTVRRPAGRRRARRR